MRRALIAFACMFSLAACSYVDPMARSLGFDAESFGGFGQGDETGLAPIARSQDLEADDRSFDDPRADALIDRPIDLLEGFDESGADTGMSDEDELGNSFANGFFLPAPVGRLKIAGIGLGGMLALAEDELMARSYAPTGMGSFAGGGDAIRINAAHPDEAAIVADITREMRFATLEAAREAAQALCEMNGRVMGFRPVAFLQVQPRREETCSFMVDDTGGYGVTVISEDGYSVVESLAVISASI